MASVWHPPGIRPIPLVGASTARAYWLRLFSGGFGINTCWGARLRVLVTGATGYVGSAVADALLEAGHDVSGLARSDHSARRMEERGVRAVAGDLKDARSVSEAARDAEAVVHAATTHGDGAEEADAMAAEAAVDAVRRNGGTFVYTSGAWVMGNTPAGVRLADEETPIEPTPMLAWRPDVEGRVIRAEGARSFVVRPALVCGGGGGVVGEMVGWAREHGVGRYVKPPDLEPSWTLVHREDLGRMYACLIESDVPGGTLFLAAGEGPYRVRDIAEAASRAAGAAGRTEPWPLEEARKELGDYADALALDQRLSAEKARAALGWKPTAPSVFEELERGLYA